MVVRIVARTAILVQPSLSCLGENSRGWPGFLLELSLRRRALVLSEVSSRSSEKGSPKRERVRVCLCFARLQLERETLPLSEEQTRSGEEASPK
ncbi:hypothetical protein DEO72_LG5g1690 [Vigna unguiculata]|uniref:Uncharacterized protein n=1 Tax=Vigna unguiculata TaxID=3917 RepID=A0A4D6LY00_VIGUN|nr:hypothetical protein DEO72_LG5g1690 [Vigna unguiculata]